MQCYPPYEPTPVEPSQNITAMAGGVTCHKSQKGGHRFDLVALGLMPAAGRQF